MPDNGWTTCREERIPSDTEAGHNLVARLLGDLEQLGWEEHDIFGVHLAVEEALMNAIKHGNQKDASKFVEIVYRMSPEAFQIEITDEGDGFDPDDVPDPTEEENLEIPSGRGLMLMRSYMTLVQFNDVGNQVVMEKIRGLAVDDDDDFYADDDDDDDDDDANDDNDDANDDNDDN
ncbi:MAG: ATP-binding protein [Planctomycetes bacterium]|nr:ATP-binding protein [Planctomycetota bacterium]